jgi:hypothetical protein
MTVESITKLTAELVRVPGHSGVDSYEPIIVHWSAG